MTDNDGGPAPSLGREHQPVKRHFEGWQLGAATVLLALAFAALGTPRASEPDVFPLPTIDREASQRSELREQERANEALQRTLPYDVRAVGEAFRRYGRFSAAGNDNAAALELDAFRERVAWARTKKADADLLRLRAVQTRFFLRALREWEDTGNQTPDLSELSGNFLERSQRNGWVIAGKLAMNESERSVLFRMRWIELASLREHFPFAPTLNEWRIYYRFLLVHPELRGQREALREAREARLRYVIALERRDASYFANLARGVLLYQLGSPLPAAEALRAHLARHPDGPWQLRARNYLIYTLQQLDDPTLLLD